MSKTLRDVYFEQFAANCGDAVKLTETKNKGYTGGSNDPFSNFRFAAQLASMPGNEPVTVEQTILSRMADKLSRLKSLLVRPDYATDDESILDTMRDLFVYSNILLIYLQLGKPGPDAMYPSEPIAVENPEPTMGAPKLQRAGEALAKIFNWSSKTAATQ